MDEQGGVYKQLRIETDFSYTFIGELKFDSNIVSSNGYPIDGGTETGHNVSWGGDSDRASFGLISLDSYYHDTGNYFDMLLSHSFQNSSEDIMNNTSICLTDFEYNCTTDISSNISSIQSDMATLAIYFDDYVGVQNTPGENIYGYTGFAKIDFSGLVGGGLCTSNDPLNCITELTLSDDAAMGSLNYLENYVFNWYYNYTMDIDAGPYLYGEDLDVSFFPFSGGSGVCDGGCTLYVGASANVDDMSAYTSVVLTQNDLDNGYVSLPMSGGWNAPDITYYARMEKISSDGGAEDVDSWSNSIEIAPADVAIEFTNSDTVSLGTPSIDVTVLSTNVDGDGFDMCTSGEGLADCEMYIYDGVIVDTSGLTPIGSPQHHLSTSGTFSLDITDFAEDVYTVVVTSPDDEGSSNFIYFSVGDFGGGGAGPTVSLEGVETVLLTEDYYKQSDSGAIYFEDCGAGDCHIYIDNEDPLYEAPGTVTAGPHDIYQVSGSSPYIFTVSGWDTGAHYARVFNADHDEVSELMVINVYDDFLIDFTDPAPYFEVGNDVSVDVTADLNCYSNGCDYYISDSPGTGFSNSLMYWSAPSGSDFMFNPDLDGLSAGTYYLKAYDGTAYEWSNEISFELNEVGGGGGGEEVFEVDEIKYYDTDPTGAMGEINSVYVFFTDEVEMGGGAFNVNNYAIYNDFEDAWAKDLMGVYTPAGGICDGAEGGYFCANVVTAGPSIDLGSPAMFVREGIQSIHGDYLVGGAMMDPPNGMTDAYHETLEYCDIGGGIYEFCDDGGGGGGQPAFATFDYYEGVEADKTVTTNDYIYMYISGDDCMSGCDYTVYRTSDGGEAYSQGANKYEPLTIYPGVLSAGSYYISIDSNALQETLDPINLTVEQYVEPPALSFSDMWSETYREMGASGFLSVYPYNATCPEGSGCDLVLYDGMHAEVDSAFIDSLSLPWEIDVSSLSPGSYSIEGVDHESGQSMTSISFYIYPPSLSFESDWSDTSRSIGQTDSVSIYPYNETCSGENGCNLVLEDDMGAPIDSITGISSFPWIIDAASLALNPGSYYYIRGSVVESGQEFSSATLYIAPPAISFSNGSSDSYREIGLSESLSVYPYNETCSGENGCNLVLEDDMGAPIDSITGISSFPWIIDATALGLNPGSSYYIRGSVVESGQEFSSATFQIYPPYLTFSDESRDTYHEMGTNGLVPIYVDGASCPAESGGCDFQLSDDMGNPLHSVTGMISSSPWTIDAQGLGLSPGYYYIQGDNHESGESFSSISLYIYMVYPELSFEDGSSRTNGVMGPNDQISIYVNNGTCPESPDGCDFSVRDYMGGVIDSETDVSSLPWTLDAASLGLTPGDYYIQAYDPVSEYTMTSVRVLVTDPTLSFSNEYNETYNEVNRNESVSVYMNGASCLFENGGCDFVLKNDMGTEITSDTGVTSLPWEIDVAALSLSSGSYSIEGTDNESGGSLASISFNIYPPSLSFESGWSETSKEIGTTDSLSIYPYRATCPEGSGCDFFLYDSLRNEIDSALDIDSPSLPWTVDAAALGLTGGIYSIEGVDHESGEQMTPISFSVLAIPEPGNYVQLSDGDYYGDDLPSEDEANIAFSGDEAWFRLDTVAGSSVDVLMSSDGGPYSLGDTKLYIYDSSAMQFGYNDDFGGNTGSCVDIIQTGEIYAKVIPYSEGSTGNFAIKYDTSNSCTAIHTFPSYNNGGSVENTGSFEQGEEIYFYVPEVDCTMNTCSYTVYDSGSNQVDDMIGVYIGTTVGNPVIVDTSSLEVDDYTIYVDYNDSTLSPLSFTLEAGLQDWSYEPAEGTYHTFTIDPTMAGFIPDDDCIAAGFKLANDDFGTFDYEMDDFDGIAFSSNNDDLFTAYVPNDFGGSYAAAVLLLFDKPAGGCNFDQVINIEDDEEYMYGMVNGGSYYPISTSETTEISGTIDQEGDRDFEVDEIRYYDDRHVDGTTGNVTGAYVFFTDEVMSGSTAFYNYSYSIYDNESATWYDELTVKTPTLGVCDGQMEGYYYCAELYVDGMMYPSIDLGPNAIFVSSLVQSAYGEPLHGGASSMGDPNGTQPYYDTYEYCDDGMGEYTMEACSGGGGELQDWSVSNDEFDHVFNVSVDTTSWAEYENYPNDYCIAAAVDNDSMGAGEFSGDSIDSLVFANSNLDPFNIYIPSGAMPYVAIAVLGFDKPAGGECSLDYIDLEGDDPVKEALINSGSFSSVSMGGYTPFDEVALYEDFVGGGGGIYATYDFEGYEFNIQNFELGALVNFYLSGVTCSGDCSYVVYDYMDSPVEGLGGLIYADQLEPVSFYTSSLSLGNYTIAVHHGPSDTYLELLYFTVEEETSPDDWSVAPAGNYHTFNIEADPSTWDGYDGEPSNYCVAAAVSESTDYEATFDKEDVRSMTFSNNGFGPFSIYVPVDGSVDPYVAMSVLVFDNTGECSFEGISGDPVATGLWNGGSSYGIAEFATTLVEVDLIAEEMFEVDDIIYYDDTHVDGMTGNVNGAYVFFTDEVMSGSSAFYADNYSLYNEFPAWNDVLTVKVPERGVCDGGMEGYYYCAELYVDSSMYPSVDLGTSSIFVSDAIQSAYGDYLQNAAASTEEPTAVQPYHETYEYCDDGMGVYSEEACDGGLGIGPDISFFGQRPLESLTAPIGATVWTHVDGDCSIGDGCSYLINPIENGSPDYETASYDAMNSNTFSSFSTWGLDTSSLSSGEYLISVYDHNQLEHSNQDLTLTIVDAPIPGSFDYSSYIEGVTCTSNLVECDLEGGSAMDYVDGDIFTGNHIYGPEYPIEFVVEFTQPMEVNGLTMTHAFGEARSPGNYMYSGEIQFWDDDLGEWTTPGTAISNGTGSCDLLAPSYFLEQPYGGSPITTKIKLINSQNECITNGWHPTEFGFDLVEVEAPSASFEELSLQTELTVTASDEISIYLMDGDCTEGSGCRLDITNTLTSEVITGPSRDTLPLTYNTTVLDAGVYTVVLVHDKYGELDELTLTVEQEPLEIKFADDSTETEIVYNNQSTLGFDLPSRCEIGTGCSLYLQQSYGDTVTVDADSDYFHYEDLGPKPNHAIPVSLFHQGLVGIMVVENDTGQPSNIIKVDVNSAITGLENVSVVDNDFGGPNISGEDFTITWDPITEVADGYEFLEYEIYVMDTRTWADMGEGLEPEHYNFYPLAVLNNMSMDTYTLPAHIMRDSGSGFSDDPDVFDRREFEEDGQYIACVNAKLDGFDDLYEEGNSPNAFTCGNFNQDGDFVPMSPILEQEGVENAENPFIVHEPSRKAIVGQDAYIYAFYRDNQTTASAVADTGDGGTEAFNLYYRANGEQSYLPAAVNFVDGDLFEFVIPSSAVVTSFDYYLEAIDSIGGTTVKCNLSSADSATCQNYPTHVEAVSAGALTVEGLVTHMDSGSLIDDGYIIPAGYAIPAQAIVEGSYAFNNVVDNNFMHIIFYASEYCEIPRPLDVKSSSHFGINFEVQEGSCIAGEEVVPQEAYPHNNMSGFPVDMPLYVSMSEPLDRPSVENNDATSDDSSVYLMDENGTRIDGGIFYCQNNSLIGQEVLCGTMPSSINNAVVFWPYEDLDPDWRHEFVITSGVVAETGRPISGNSDDGNGHKVTFWTCGDYKDPAYCGTPGYTPPQFSGSYPQDGEYVSGSISPTITFNNGIDPDTVNSETVKLLSLENNVYISIETETTDGNTQIKIHPNEELTEGLYRIELRGGITGHDGLAVSCEFDMDVVAFESNFNVTDSIVESDEFPEIEPPFEYGSDYEPGDIALDVPITIPLEFEINGPLNNETVNSQNIHLYRGANKVIADVFYEDFSNRLMIRPASLVLLPNTNYSVVFSTGVTSNGNSLDEKLEFLFKTSSLTDAKAPKIMPGPSWCSIHHCFVQFNEVMNESIDEDSSKYASSAMNIENYTIEMESYPGAGDMIPYSISDSARIQPEVFMPGLYRIENLGFEATDVNNKFRLTVSNAADSSGNAVDETGNAFVGVLESDDGSDNGNDPQNTEDLGKVIQPIPGNPYAGEGMGDAFQIYIHMEVLGTTLQDGDQLRFSFPFSPNNEMNSANLDMAMWENPDHFGHDFAPEADAKVNFEDLNEIEVDQDLNQLTVNLSVEGILTSEDYLTIPLRDIVNPGNSKYGEYKLYVEHLRNGQLMTSKAIESETYDVQGNDGSNTLQIDITAGTATGFVEFIGRRPGIDHPQFKHVQLENGVIVNVNGESVSSIVYSNVPDGCYETEVQSFADLSEGRYVSEDLLTNSGSDNAGLEGTRRNLCVYGGETVNVEYNYVPLDESGIDFIDLTVKMDRDSAYSPAAPVDIVVSPPSGMPLVENIDAFTTPNANGYTVSIPVLPGTVGNWQVSVEPGFLGQLSSKPAFNLFDSYAAHTIPLELTAAGELVSRDTTSEYGKRCSNSGYYSFDEETDTVTFDINRGAIEVPVEIINSSGDAIEASGIEIFAFGNCGKANAKTNSSGEATLYLDEFDSYGVHANYEWFHNDKRIKVKSDSNGNPEGVYFGGQKVISYSNGTPTGSIQIPLDIEGTLVSGDIRNTSGEKITGTPFLVEAYEESTGKWINKHTQETNGTWSMVLPFDGEWTVKLKPNGESSSDLCGSFKTEVDVDGETSITNQHIQADSGGATCYSVSGTVTIPGISVGFGNVYARQVNPTTYQKLSDGYEIDVPLSGDEFTLALPEGSYMIGFWAENFGHEEFFTIDGDATIDLSPGAIGTVTFDFVGGSAGTGAFVNMHSGNNHFDNHIESTSDSFEMKVPEGTYDYFLDINCVGSFEGTTSTGGNVTIDLSGMEMATLSGTIYDEDGNGLDGTFVDAHDFDQRVHCGTQTDNNGAYSMSVRKGTFWINVFKEKYIMHDEVAEQLALSADRSGYDFGGAATAPRAALVEADRVIEVTLYEDDGTTPIRHAGVNALSNGFAQPGIPNDDGTFILYVIDGDWEIEVYAPGYNPLEGDYAELITILGEDEDLTIVMPTALKNPNRVSLIHTESVHYTTGKSINQMDSMGMSVKFEPGFMTENAVVTMKRDFVAKKTASQEPVCGLTYDLSIVTDAGTPQTTFLQPITITLEYDPSCVSMQILENIENLASGSYYDESIQGWQLTDNTYINPTAKTIKFTTTHLTEFAVVTPPSEEEDDDEEDEEVVEDTPGGGGGGGGGGSVAKQLYTEAVTSIADEVVEDEYQTPDDGLIETAITVQNTDTDAFVTISADTKVTDADGDEYEGVITPPTTVDMDVTVPSSKYRLVSDVFEVGSDATQLFFDKKIKVVIPIDQDINPQYHLVAYRYNEESGAWEYETEGSIKVMNGDYVFEFSVEHLTKFAVFYDTSVKVNIFDDITNHWAKTYIEFLYSRGIISGYADGTFGADNTITRAEFTKIAIEAFDVSLEDGIFSTFTDVKSTDWFAPYVESAYENSIVKGYDNGTFKPHSPITRAEAMKVLMTSAGIDVSGAANAGFSDIPAGIWYGPYVNYAKSLGIVGGYGDGRFGPENDLRRGEVAKIVSLLLISDAGSAVSTALGTSL